MRYSESYKKSVIAKVFGPPQKSVGSVARAEGIAHSTVWTWMKEKPPLGKQKRNDSSKSHEWSAEEKLRILNEVSGLTEEERGAYLRKNGLYEATLRQWREDALAGLSGKKPSATDMELSKADRQQLKVLEHELQEKEKALAEMAVLLALKKKVQAIWGAEENGTPKKSGK